MKEVWHKHLIRVHYGDTDQMQVVHHGNYVNWFEIARTEWMRANGIAYGKMEALGLMLPVLNLQVKYRKPALYDQGIGLYAKIQKFSAVRLEFYYEARKLVQAGEELPINDAPQTAPEGELLASGMTSHMWLDKNWKPVRIDKNKSEIFDLLQKELEN